MKIDSITMREIRMPLVHFFETSFGRTTERCIILLEIESQGLTGWGECVAGEHPFYSEECIDTAWPILANELIPAVLGQKIFFATDVVSLLARVRGNRMAKSSIEKALSRLTIGVLCWTV